MSEKQLRAVSSAVKRNTTLTSLNGVGKSSLYYHNLRGRNTKDLDLKGAGLGTEDITIMSDLLSTNTTLRSLDLSHNNLGDDGGKSVANALARNVTMHTLDVSSCGLGTVAGTALKEMSDKGGALTSLVLEGNPVESQLSSVGFSAEKLRDVGFTASMLKLGGFNGEDLRLIGFTAKQMKAGGFTAQELSDGGFAGNQLKLVGFTETELLAVGFTPQELKSKLGLEGVAAVRSLDLSVPMPITWDKSSRDKGHDFQKPAAASSRSGR